MALAVLTVVGLILLKLSLNILHPRQWILHQAVTDAYMTFERARAERVPFEDLLAVNSLWPASTPAVANVATTPNVEVGRLPGNIPIFGTVTRTRLPDPGNYPIDGGIGTLVTNPAAMKVWRVKAVLTYRIGSRTYAKARTVVRSQ